MIPEPIRLRAETLMESWLDRATPNPDYMFGIWLERRFNAEIKMGLDWNELHQIARDFCAKNGI